MTDSSDRPSEITRLLQQSTPDYHTIMPLVYAQLLAMAQGSMRHERSAHTLSATALVHETFVRMTGGQPISWADSGHFFRIAATVMRRVLVDHARSKACLKRQGGIAQVPYMPEGYRARIETAFDLIDQGSELAILSLEEAMCRLEKEDDELANLVRLRFYAGLTIEQTAATTGLSVATVKRRWAFARAILLEAMQRATSAPASESGNSVGTE